MFLAALTIGACASVTPRHEILPKPAHIRAGVAAGDTVEVETRDGRSIKMVVTEVRAGELVSDSEVVPFTDIVTIAKRSWQPPEHPCGGGKPVGCSIPEVVLLLSEDYNRQADKFQPACRTHDFCYRHGFATYGEARNACDEQFYEDMQDACESMGLLSIIDAKEFGICRAAALQTFEAVRRYGEPHYQTATSTYCEYR